MMLAIFATHHDNNYYCRSLDGELPSIRRGISAIFLVILYEIKPYCEATPFLTLFSEK